MSNYKTNRETAISLRVSIDELGLLDKLVSRYSKYWRKKSRTDIIVDALKLYDVVRDKMTEVNVGQDELEYIDGLFKVVYSPKTDNPD